MKNSDSDKTDTDFHQQTLAAWQPLLTPKWVIGIFGVAGVLFVVIGIIVGVASNTVVEFSSRYDNLDCESTDDRGCWVKVAIKVEREMKPPILFYYRLTNFYQNHRRYVKSRSDEQLRGGLTPDISTCDPLEKDEGGRVIYPCGLIANSYFNDSFVNASRCTTNEESSCTTLSWTDQGIAWESDKKKKFKLPSNFEQPEWNRANTRIGSGNFTLPLPVKEDFIVWMRAAGLPHFRKLRYRIEDTLQPGDLFVLDIYSTFPVSSFSGTKSVVISTSSWIGGKNDFLWGAYILVGVLCLVVSLFFLTLHRCKPRPLGLGANFPNESR